MYCVNTILHSFKKAFYRDCLLIMMSSFSNGIALLMALAKMRALSPGKCCADCVIGSKCLETMYGFMRATWILPTCLFSVGVAG